jgi:hypothetical protein
MTSQQFTVERIDVTTTHRFEEAEAILEKNAPVVAPGLFKGLVESRASAEEIKAKVSAAQGALQLLILAKLSQGELTSLLGTPKKLTVYLVGNPVIANRMFERNRGAGLYAPLRASLYEDTSGKVHFTYDRPSALLGSFGDAEIDAVAAILDGRMATLAQRIAE